MPEENEKLHCSHKRGNFYDRFAIKTTSGNRTTIGHLPKELSRVTKYLLDRGETLSLELSFTNYRRSPLVQGELETACTVTAKMPAAVKNQMLIDRYQELVYERYAAPKEEVILGSFLVAVPRPLQRSAEKKKIETKKRATKTKSSKQKDIRQMFSAMKQKGSITIEDKIVID